MGNACICFKISKNKNVRFKTAEEEKISFNILRIISGGASRRNVRYVQHKEYHKISFEGNPQIIVVRLDANLKY